MPAELRRVAGPARVDPLAARRTRPRRSNRRSRPSTDVQQQINKAAKQLGARQRGPDQAAEQRPRSDAAHRPGAVRQRAGELRAGGDQLLDVIGARVARPSTTRSSSTGTPTIEPINTAQFPSQPVSLVGACRRGREVLRRARPRSRLQRLSPAGRGALDPIASNDTVRKVGAEPAGRDHRAVEAREEDARPSRAQQRRRAADDGADLAADVAREWRAAEPESGPRRRVVQRARPHVAFCCSHGREDHDAGRRFAVGTRRTHHPVRRRRRDGRRHLAGRATGDGRGRGRSTARRSRGRKCSPVRRRSTRPARGCPTRPSPRSPSTSSGSRAR